jgi:flagellar basal-body rod protein FlgB
MQAAARKAAMTGKIDDYLRFHETALNLRAQRQQLLASNIANADTPNYKARDIDFRQTLQGALQRPAAGAAAGAAPAVLLKTSANHLSGTTAGFVGAGHGALEPQYRQVQQGSVDGNSVDMDAERNQFADNALRYEAGITLVSGQIKSLLTAIQGQ